MSSLPPEIIWKAPEFKYYAKGVGWYGVSILIAILLVFFAIWQKNFLFALFVAVAELALVSWAKRQPAILEFRINKKGVGIGNVKFYPYEELAGFHVRESPGDSELVLKAKSRLHPYIKISIFDKDTSEIKDFLKELLPEIEYNESLSDDIVRKIGF